MNDELDVELVLEDRPTLGVNAAPPGTFTERIFLGRPDVTDISTEDLTPEQRQVLAQHADRRFLRAGLPVTLVHDDRNPFESLWLQITLHTSPPSGLAVARSMDPDLLSEPVESTRATKLGASLKFVAERSSQVTVTSRTIYLEALYEGGNTPTWSFTRTEQEIRGLYLLSLVIEAERPVGISAVAQLGATVRAHRLGLFSYQSHLSPQTSLLFTVPPVAAAHT